MSCGDIWGSAHSDRRDRFSHSVPSSASSEVDFYPPPALISNGLIIDRGASKISLRCQRSPLDNTGTVTWEDEEEEQLRADGK